MLCCKIILYIALQAWFCVSHFNLIHATCHQAAKQADAGQPCSARHYCFFASAHFAIPAVFLLLMPADPAYAADAYTQPNHHVC